MEVKGSYPEPSRRCLCPGGRLSAVLSVCTQPPSCKPPRLSREQMSHPCLWNEQLIDICPSIVFRVFLGRHTPRSEEGQCEMEWEWSEGVGLHKPLWDCGVGLGREIDPGTWASPNFGLH